MTVGKFRQHYSRSISLSDPEQVNVVVLLIKMLIVCVFILLLLFKKTNKRIARSENNHIFNSEAYLDTRPT